MNLLLGLTNHWLAIYIQKIKDEVETVILDSRNNFIIERTDEEMREMITRRLIRSGNIIRFVIDIRRETRRY